MTCIGIGVDIVQSSRIKSTIEVFGEYFFKRVFSERENFEIIKLIEAFGNSSDFLVSFCAKRFAAKEAFIKSVGRSFAISLKEISSEKNSFGKPDIFLYGNTLKRFIDFVGGNNNYKIFLSLADDGGFAIANVHIEL